MARVSVVMPSYNHARFIGDAVASILAQTMEDLELIVVDDGSHDNSNEIVAAIEDPRLKHIPLPSNVGACAAFDHALAISTGEFVALCNSDDMWVPDKLERQLSIIQSDRGIGAVFSDVTCIDENGKKVDESRRPSYANVFRQPNRSRPEWIRTLVEDGNCLCHPSVLVRREAYNTIGSYNNLLRQMPDHDLWLRMVQHYNIYVMQDQLVLFRVHESNTSRPSPANLQRIYRERVLLTKQFFCDVSPENFHAAFMPDGAAVPRNPVEFLRAKVTYLTHTKSELRNEMLDMAIDASYFGSIEHKEEIVPSRSFHILTAQPAPQLLWSTIKYRIKSNIERVAGTRISNLVFNAAIRIKRRGQEKARR